MDLSSSFCVSWPEGTRYYHSGRLFCGKPHGLGHRHGTGELGQWETDWTKASRRGPSGCRCKQKLLWLRDFNWFKLEKMINSFFFRIKLSRIGKKSKSGIFNPNLQFWTEKYWEISVTSPKTGIKPKRRLTLSKGIGTDLSNWLGIWSIPTDWVYYGKPLL